MYCETKLFATRQQIFYENILSQIPLEYVTDGVQIAGTHTGSLSKDFTEHIDHIRHGRSVSPRISYYTVLNELSR